MNTSTSKKDTDVGEKKASFPQFTPSPPSSNPKEATRENGQVGQASSGNAGSKKDTTNVGGKKSSFAEFTPSPPSSNLMAASRQNEQVGKASSGTKGRQVLNKGMQQSEPTKDELTKGAPSAHGAYTYTANPSAAGFPQLTPDTTMPYPSSNVMADTQLKQAAASPSIDRDSVEIDIEIPSTPLPAASQVGAFRSGGSHDDDDDDEGTISGNTIIDPRDATRMQGDENSVHVAELVDQDKERRAIVAGAREEIHNEILLNAPIAEAVPDNNDGNNKGFWSSRRSILCLVVLVVAVVAAISAGAAAGASRSKEAAAPSPSPTLAPTALEAQTLSTTTSYTHAYHGHMFDITAKADIKIVAMDIHMKSTGLERIEVWAKEGGYHGYETDSFRWANIRNVTVNGMGVNALTPLPRFDGVRVTAGEKHSFYVTAKTEIIYFQERMNEFNNVSLIDYGQATEFANSDVEINVGTGVQYLFQGHGPPNIFNGAIHYVVV